MQTDSRERVKYDEQMKQVMIYYLLSVTDRGWLHVEFPSQALAMVVEVGQLRDR